MSLTTRAIDMTSMILCVTAVVALTIPEPAAACRTKQSIISPWLPVMFTPLPCPEDLTTGMKNIAPAADSSQRLSPFVEAMFDNLTADIARGGGEYVSSLATLLGRQSEHNDAFAEELRELSLRDPDILANHESFLRRIAR